MKKAAIMLLLFTAFINAKVPTVILDGAEHDLGKVVPKDKLNLRNPDIQYLPLEAQIFLYHEDFEGLNGYLRSDQFLSRVDAGETISLLFDISGSGQPHKRLFDLLSKLVKEVASIKDAYKAYAVTSGRILDQLGWF